MEVFQYDKHRVREIDAFMKALIQAETTSEKVDIYKKYETFIEDITPLDMFHLHHYSNDTNLDISEIKKTANKFVNVFHKGLEKHAKNFKHDLLKLLLEESQAMENHLNEIKTYYKKGQLIDYKESLIMAFKDCMTFEKKFIKFENIIFPQLEKKLPSTKPFEVLWSLHDDARQQLKVILDSLSNKTYHQQILMKKISRYYDLIFGINQKEKLIIMPLLEQLFEENQLDKMFNEALDYGYAMLEDPQAKSLEGQEESHGFFHESNGQLSYEDIGLIMNHLPVDITYVDSEDRVRYYNQRKERHFPRNPSVIGRLVKHCHPPKSVKIVEKIISDFKNNDRDQAEFWIEMNQRFLYIVYYALRDEQGRYKGVLEVSQDVTKIRALQGEKRLLDE